MRARDAMSARVKSAPKDSSRSATNLTGRPVKQRERHRRQLVAVGVDLQTEAAAHVRRDDPHLRLGQPEMPRHIHCIMYGTCVECQTVSWRSAGLKSARSDRDG